MYIRFPGGKAKALTLSYDDGVVYDRNLVDILNKNGLKCTFNLNSGCFRKEGVSPLQSRKLSADEALELFKDSGHEVALHGLRHLSWADEPTAKAMYDIIEDKKQLEDMFGIPVRGAAYPYGSFNDKTVEILKLAEIVYCRTTIATNSFDVPNNPLTLKPTCHHKSSTLFDLAAKFTDEFPVNAPWLFYVWGHSFEFNDDKNWDIIERFAEMTGGNDEVWYATNIEIFDYISDYNRLICAADGSFVINPTSRDIWFLNGRRGETIKLAAGERIDFKQQ